MVTGGDVRGETADGLAAKEGLILATHHKQLRIPYWQTELNGYTCLLTTTDGQPDWRT